MIDENGIDCTPYTLVLDDDYIMRMKVQSIIDIWGKGIIYTVEVINRLEWVIREALGFRCCNKNIKEKELFTK